MAKLFDLCLHSVIIAEPLLGARPLVIFRRSVVQAVSVFT